MEHVERGAQYADPFQDIACSGGNNTQTTVSGGAGDSYTVRIRGADYADPFEDIGCG